MELVCFFKVKRTGGWCKPVRQKTEWIREPGTEATVGPGGFHRYQENGTKLDFMAG